MFNKKKILTLLLAFLLLFNTNVPFIYAAQQKVDVQAVQTESCKYPDYAKMYVGDDKFEKLNRKIFNLNTKLNKFIARPVHILWSSIIPKAGIDKLRNAYNNIEYPKRLASCLLQKDKDGIKKETIRFLTNSTLGIGGLFDPAEKVLKIKPTEENMEQALCKCKMCSGPYLVAPVLNSCTPRSLCGRLLEAALDPSVYFASPLTALVKFGLMVNRTSYMQPLAKMIEDTFADPYDIQKKLYGIENYIKNSNLNRQDLFSEESLLAQNKESAITEEIMTQIDDIKIEPLDINKQFMTGAATPIDEEDVEIIRHPEVDPDIILSDYNPQSPVVDSMRTALFDNPDINKSIWNELSIWNRSFARRIKTGQIVIDKSRAPYQFRYILQKDKSAPIAILYPSIGEGVNTHHSEVFAKFLYDNGYSVIMQGSHFHWEFVNSMPVGYCPGKPKDDIEYIRLVSSKILENLSKKYEREFDKKIVIGTSFGALATLFLADMESKNNTLGINKFIAISPPIELTYALKQLDKNADEFDKNSPEVKHKTALTAAKILQLFQAKDSPEFQISELPFSDEEGKLITTFILRQKLSDLIFTIENISKGKKTNIYESINNMSYQDYVEKYILANDSSKSLDDIQYETSLYSLSNYLANNDNYKIYHSLDDYFINKKQLEKLKTFARKNLVCLNCGAHLGYLYRKEFQNALQNDIVQN